MRYKLSRSPLVRPSLPANGLQVMQSISLLVPSVKRGILASLILAAFGSTPADVSLSPLFSDHAVLQKSERTPLWGVAAPGEDIFVSLGSANGGTKAGPDGRWKITLDLSEVAPGPHDMVVQGKNRLVASDVLIGEVWLCGGQSNMEFSLSAFPCAKEEIPISSNTQLREFKVRVRAASEPVEDVEGQWTVASPQTSGRFSATAYFFGKQLQGALGAPVGLITSSMGGTVIQSWMSAEALARDPELKEGMEVVKTARDAYDHFLEEFPRWQSSTGRLDRPPTDVPAFAAPEADLSGWTEVTLPGVCAGANLPTAGAIWIRRTIPIPPEMAGKPLDLNLGRLLDGGEIYWNGRKAGASDIASTDARCRIKGDLVKQGDAALAVRLFSAAGEIGIAPDSPRFFISGSDGCIPLAGRWLARAEFALPELTPAELASRPARPAVPRDAPNVATYLYNGMIHPVIPCAMRGVIWYHGEANWDQGYQYRTAFPLLIRDWREKAGQPDLPFYFCQIANYQDRKQPPGDSRLAEVREAQTLALSLPATGQAVLIDVGEDGNIHPADKMTVGDRLARLALAKTYGRDVPWSGPAFQSMQVEGDAMRITFSHADGGLVARPLPHEYAPNSAQPALRAVMAPHVPGSELQGFALCGRDRVWRWASARIEGNAVVVSAAEISQPIAVRYAWNDNPICNLYNAAGLPAAPFRTDDFPLVSRRERYGLPRAPVAP